MELSTRSLIGIQLDENIVKYVYCHWDGYPENNGQILVDSYKDKDKIIDLMQRGSFSSLREQVDDIAYYNEEDNNPHTMSIKKYFGKKDISWSEYRYLYTLENKWIVYDVYEKTVRDVEDILIEIQEKEDII